MDWLDKYKPVLICKERIVSLETELGRIAKVTCDDFGVHLSNLLHGIEASPEGVESIEVVKDFPDVFEEVKGFPCIGR